ncbi:glycogen synthase [Vibrio zhanjiangensis]|uniref:Glycogen synthase n=1 Tax=Vibrio zhanjiangensis TaxID=1046128 RepID=A0ABQ6EYA5_9VIBR|nr:glycogen synthase GlgA [Vibrio zhanjiangensis]GLT17671.1 glycogen synthase [Vibrio zhanjiangensis]
MDTKSLSVLFVASEVEGLIKSGGLADVAKALPEALVTLNQDVRIALPAYQQISHLEKATVLLDTQLEHSPHTEYRVLELRISNVVVYAIDCPKYFNRSEMYAVNNRAYSDNGERFAFFSAASLDMLPKLGFRPNIVHANDWHTGLVPYLLKYRHRQSEFYAEMKSIMTVHNAIFKGVFSYDDLLCLPEMQTRYAPDAAVSPTHITMLKAGVMTADKISAVSPTYAEELKTEMGSHGMSEEFRARQADLVGILNGCDYSLWNPKTDPYLEMNYQPNKDSLKRGKKACKYALQTKLGLDIRDVAVYGMVCRLTNQKGIQYLLPILERFLSHQVQFVIVGTGDPSLAVKLRDIQRRHGRQFKFIEAYSNELAHMVEAGADVFVMPSEFEPCGLNQIYSMAYGTLPIVRAVGGLKDTVVDYATDPDRATGFVFNQPKPSELLITLQHALLVYEQQPEEFMRVQLNAMEQNFSWSIAADEYLSLYNSVLM